MFICLSTAKAAQIEALFHPYDPTLSKIAAEITSAKESIDIAMYNLDSYHSNPVVKALSSQTVQDRIDAGDLKIRMIYEGYSGYKAAYEKSLFFESLGVDVRWLASSKKVHHKFALMDAHLPHGMLVSGSANWSLNSRNNYNENILFIKESPAIFQNFKNEFELLWEASQEFGFKDDYFAFGNDFNLWNADVLSAHFNSDNFVFDGHKVSKNKAAPGYTLTRLVSKAIDEANDSLKIATTRIMLRPIYNAIVKAAKRGVQIEMIVSMEQYSYEKIRQNWTLTPCESPYAKSCSTSINFAHFLDIADFAGSENIRVRLKFYNFNPRAFLSQQMHSKYMIVDNRKIYSGSFNWSYSAEYYNFANVIVIDGKVFPKPLASFQEDFHRIYNLGRMEFNHFRSNLDKALANGSTIDCRFLPASLSYDEIDSFLSMGVKHGKPLKDGCD